MKIKLTILFIAIFIIVLSCSASALGYMPDDVLSSDFSITSTSYSDSLPSYEFLSFYEVYYFNSSTNFSFTTYFFSVDFSIMEETLENSSFYHSNVDLVDYLELNPSLHSNFVIFLYNNPDIYSNLSSIFLSINSYGSYLRDYRQHEIRINELEDLVYEYENVKLPFAESNGYAQGYSTGQKTGYNKGYTQGFNEGETAGIETADVAKTSILTVLSAPFYALSSIFNFEIFGINILTIVTTLITLAVIAFVLKKIKG